MIERLLAAESALEDGELEVAGRMFAQVADADARNAIAVVGLARIAAREGRTDEAHGLLERALAIDPDEAAAQRLLRELYVSAASPGGAPGDVRAPVAVIAPDPGPSSPPAGEPLSSPVDAARPEGALELAHKPAWASDPEAGAARETEPVAAGSGTMRASLLGRLRAWLAAIGRRS